MNIATKTSTHDSSQGGDLDGKALRALRLAAGLTVAECAKRAGVPTAKWVHYEQGSDRFIPPDTWDVLRTPHLTGANSAIEGEFKRVTDEITLPGEGDAS